MELIIFRWNMYKILSILIVSIFLFISCNNNGDKQEKNKKADSSNTGGQAMNETQKALKDRISIYAPVSISVDVSSLSDNDRKVLKLLAEAGNLADQIFWRQTSPEAIPLRDSLKKLSTADAKLAYEFVMINYGPYDRIDDGKRYIGSGSAKFPSVANFYPQDLTKEEFEKYIAANAREKAALESQYTVVKREGNKLIAIPYNKEYPQAFEIAKKLDEASALAENTSLKNYLKLRAEAIRTDNYFKSDMAWMDILGSDIDMVIGPIENYEDGLFNYKTAYECMLMVRDHNATKELQLFLDHIDSFEQKLPCDKKYIRPSAGKGNILQIVNIAYMGGDSQSGVKTIANSLPNDPEVTKIKGGKKSMFKNIMEAKFDKIVKPIADIILDENLRPYVDKKAFTSFVTLHEVSHTLGRGFVYGKNKLAVRKALQSNYSAIEETKADILGLYNHKHLLEEKVYTEEYIMKVIATYVAGLFRSIRFGAEEAHGMSNVIQLNYMAEKGAIIKNNNGTLNINRQKFFDVAAELAGIILTIEAEGDLKASQAFIDKYGKLTDDTKKIIETLKLIPRDINTTYEIKGL
jgi:hypothetical protein